MDLDGNDWEPTFEALTAGTYWSLLPSPKTVQYVNWVAFVERCRRALRQVEPQTAMVSWQEAGSIRASHRSSSWWLLPTDVECRRDSSDRPTACVKTTTI